MLYYVFIDTNIYEESNFSFENGKFSKLKEMIKEGKVILLYNEIIYREVRQHIEDNIKEAVGEFNAAVKNKGFAPFRNSKDWEEHIALLDEKILINQQWQAWDDYLKDCGAIKIPTKNVNVDAILDNYFKKILPFENKKPNEFKDAIIIESIRGYFEVIKKNEYAEELFVVTADKGVRKSFRDDKGITTFDNLNKFINYVILHTEYLAVAVNERIKEYKILFDYYIGNNLIDQLSVSNFDVEDFYDIFAILDAEYIDHKIGYINIINTSLAEVTVEILAKICVDYMERDEDTSYYDKETGTYILEGFVEYHAWHKVSFEALLYVDINELNENAIQEKVESSNRVLEEFDESILSFIIGPKRIQIPKDSIILMNEGTLIERKIAKRIFEGEEIGEAYIGQYCPCCGEIITFQNNGMNGLCINCASGYR